MSRKFCAHCEESLAPRTFREHARLYYDPNSHSWTKKRKLDSDELNEGMQLVSLDHGVKFQNSEVARVQHRFPEFIGFY